MRKWILPALIAVIVVQLSAPAYMIYSKYDVLRTGEEFLFRVYPVDPYDAFRGRYVSLNASQAVSGQGRYGVIEVDADGFAFIAEVSGDKPASAHYVKSNDRSHFSIPIDRYYMDEKLAPEAETLTRRNAPGGEAYVTVRVKNGKMVVSGLFIDGMAIESIIREGV